jgi:hypothetical protein
MNAVVSVLDIYILFRKHRIQNGKLSEKRLPASNAPNAKIGKTAIAHHNSLHLPCFNPRERQM